jgi:hypothetical protein
VRKRDWLSRDHRLRVADLAIKWLATCPSQEISARRFGAACTVIERYLIEGGPATAQLHEESEGLKIVVPFVESTKQP